MIKKSDRLSLILLLCLSLTNFTSNQALAENTLNQVDVRRNASDGLEFTLYTSSPYADNVVVTKKSDNKYVILMPNVNNAPNAKPDFSAVKDIVSDLDVRAVNDGQGGYTKVTVITNRPVDIKTNTAKTAPVTQEQREYRALIAQQKSKPSAPPIIQEKTESNSFKLPEIQPTKTAADIVSVKSNSKESDNKNITTQTKQIKVANNTQTKKVSETKPAVSQKVVSVEKKQLKELNNIIPTAIKKTEPIKIESKEEKLIPDEKVSLNNEIKKEVSVPETKQPEQKSKPIMDNDKQIQSQENIKPLIALSKDISKIKNKILGRMPKNMPITIAVILIPILCIIALFNLIRASLRNSNLLKKSFMDNIAKRKNVAQVPNYDNIINNESLSWQEKYQQYIDASGEKPESAKKVSKYNFVKEIPIDENIKAEFIEEEPVEKLERIMQASPDIEKTIIADDIAETETALANTDNIADETVNINKTLSKTIKLKAFAEKTALEETHRNKKIKHRRIHLEIPKEMPHINLGYSKLHTNPRTFKNATLSVSDLIANSNKLLNIKPECKEDKNDYEMISIDEYFNIMSDDKSNVTSSLSKVVANSLDKSKSTKLENKSIPTRSSNPIKTAKKENPLNGLLIKSKFDINKDSGFYLVSLEGKSAVIGKVKDEIFVLKKFDRNITKPLQVRKDNQNVYMIKADDFKSLVEVNNDKMGVLIEL